MTAGVLFDKDGTLFDFEATWYPVVRTILDVLKTRYRLDDDALKAVRTASGITETGFARESFIQSRTTFEVLELWIGVLKEHGIRVEGKGLTEIFDTTATGPIFSAKVVPGTQALLGRLRNNGCRLGVVTSDDRVSAEHGLRQAGLWEYFDYVAANGDGFPDKPAPEAAAEFRRRFGIAPSGLSMFGDSLVDMEFARNAGARFIGMKTSCNDYSRFVDAGFPVVEDFLDLAAIERLLA